MNGKRNQQRSSEGNSRPGWRPGKYCHLRELYDPFTACRYTIALRSIRQSELLEGVKGVVLSDNQVQVIFGPGKAQRAADAMNALLANSGETLMQAADIAAKTKSQLKAKQTSGVQQFLSKFATIFTPLIPGFIAAGLLLGIATLIGTVMHLPADAQGMLADALNLMKVFSKGALHLPGDSDWL
ncbi:PTS system N-acetylmuramic acid transporter subunits EIIBC [Salmonella enterica subsp. arizonae]|uniref:PTS system N-acetylmuramic acid transporter subunits EIIBC n=1 Tax=Salmonella enterica subsp. arizonae TaxID=59203 RepID=A0A379SLI0_SALER|nr:PTS system N-acetylmuramic acid transporter subunits EIIBC [Salmonella enterica subsp. arizonae]